MNTIALIVTIGTIVQVTLIVAVILVTLGFKLYSRYQHNLLKQLKLDIETYIIEHMVAQSQITDKSFPEKWRNLGILLQIIKKFDKDYQVGGWLYIRSNFIKNIILPLARVRANSNDWQIRQLSAIAYSLNSEKEDEKNIIALINDQIPLIRYIATNAGIKFGSEFVINSIIVNISKESWLTQTMYMTGFATIPYATHYYLENILKNSSELNIRATTYHLLLKFPTFPISWDIYPLHFKMRTKASVEFESYR